MLNRKISVPQALILFTMTNAVTNHVIIIPLLLNAGQRDAWLSVIAAAAPACLLALVVTSILQTAGRESLYGWLERLTGRFGAGTIAALFALYLLSLIYITLKDTVNWVNVTFLPYTPQSVVGGVLVALCFAAAYKGLWPIAVSAGALLPFVVLLGWFVATANLHNKDYSLLKPVLEHGLAPVWKGSLYASCGIWEVILLLLLNQHMSHRIRRSALLIYIVTAIALMLGPLLGSLANFGPAEAMKQRYPAFEQWRLVSIGKYINHLDFFSIYQWMSGSFIRISLFMFLVPDLLQAKRQPVRLLILLLLSAAMIACLLLPVSDMRFIRFLQNVYSAASCALVSLLAAVLFLLSRIALMRDRRTTPHAGDTE